MANEPRDNEQDPEIEQEERAGLVLIPKEDFLQNKPRFEEKGKFETEALAEEDSDAKPQAYVKHFVWSITKSDSFKFLYKMLICGTAGSILYIIGSLHIWAMFAVFVGIPVFLFVAHLFKPTIFTEEYRELNLIRVKYITFIIQNCILFAVYFYGTDRGVSIVMAWTLRVNVWEVFIDFVLDRRWLYLIPSLVLMLTWFYPFVDAPDAMFPYLELERHERYVVVWKKPNIWFIIVYTGWFIGWIIHRSDRILTVMHTIFPLLAPPELWWSVRTFTGAFMLWFMYLSVLKPVIWSPENVKERFPFSEIYDPLYVMVFIGAYTAPWLMNADIGIS